MATPFSSTGVNVGVLRGEVGVWTIETGQFARRGAMQEKLLGWVASDSAHRIAVAGQGGSGKSTLAQRLLNDIRHSSKELPALRLVFFLQAGDGTKLMAGYRDLLRELNTVLGRQGPEPEKDEDLRELVHRLLRDKAIESAWVGVLDDLPPPSIKDLQEHGLEWLLCSDQRGFPWRSGKTIVTSRFRTWVDKPGFGHSFVVGNLEEEEAHALLQDKLEHWREDAGGVAAVARRLSYFPLALASAVGCAGKYHLSPSEYMQELDKCRSDVLDAWGVRERAQDEYPYELFEVLHDAWRRLSECREGEAVTTLLRKLAFLDPCDIPVETFGDFRVLLPILEEHCLVSV